MNGYLRGNPDLQAYPMTLIIENTTKCNLECPMCPREFGYYPPEDFSYDLFKHVIDEIRDQTELVFPWGAGEPLMNPDVYKMIRYCSDANIYTVVSTNATLLTEKRSHQLIDAGLNNLIIAVDGTTAEVYEKYRKGAKFEKVKKNIFTFLKVKKQRQADLFVVLQMVRLPDNRHQIREFQKIWSIEGVNEVRIKEDEIVIPEVALKERVHHKKTRHPCYQLWQGPATINYKGDFFPCCHMWQTKPLGNVKEKSVFELWNSRQMQQLRQAHVNGDLSDYPECDSCHAPNPRLPLILGTFLVDMLKVRKWIPKMERMALFYKAPLFRDR